MAVRHSVLRLHADDVDSARVLVAVGVLDATTYLEMRDAVVKAALDEPRAVVIDVSDLSVREDPAWAVFASARWQIAEWPDTPVALVSGRQQDLNILRRNGVTRYIPVYATLAAALAELSVDGQQRYRRRARASISARPSSIRECRELVAQWLTEWSRVDFTHAVSFVTAELVEAALTATDTNFALRLETDGSTVSVVIQHVGIAGQTSRSESSDHVSGLDLVAANSRASGTYTTLTGNTMWAVVGPENRF